MKKANATELKLISLWLIVAASYELCFRRQFISSVPQLQWHRRDSVRKSLYALYGFNDGTYSYRS